jgi:hypothetical protein
MYSYVASTPVARMIQGGALGISHHDYARVLRSAFKFGHCRPAGAGILILMAIDLFPVSDNQIRLIVRPIIRYGN